MRFLRIYKIEIMFNAVGFVVLPPILSRSVSAGCADLRIATTARQTPVNARSAGQFGFGANRLVIQYDSRSYLALADVPDKTAA